MKIIKRQISTLQKPQQIIHRLLEAAIATLILTT